jgi:hypothetical protein
METRQLKKLSEKFEDDDEENLGVYSSGFDASEMDGDALAAAMADFKKDNIDFVPLGKSKFEKNLDIDQMKSDLSADNLNLPKRKAELSKHQNTLDKRYKHEKRFGVGSLNEWEGPQPGDSEYHNPGPNKKQHGISRFNEIDWQVLHETLVANEEFMNTGKVEGNPRFYKIYASDLTDSDEGMLTNEDLNLLVAHDIVNVYKNNIELVDDKFLDYNTFYQAVQDAWAKGFPPVHNDNSSEMPFLRGRELDEEVSDEEEKEFNFDQKSLYHFLQDAFDQLSIYNEAEAAKILEAELLKYYDIKPKKMFEGAGLIRPKDANGIDITNKARVKHLESGAVGHVLHPGYNNGEQTIHVAWLDNSLSQMPPKEVLPSEIVVDDDTRVVREATARTISNGRAANARPETYPAYFERDVNNKNLAYTGVPEMSLANKISNTELDIMANVKAMNAQKEDPLMNLVPKPAVETIKYTMYEKERLEEGYDFAADERQFFNQLNQQELDQYVGKEIKIINSDIVIDLANNSEKRLNSIMDDLKNELNSQRIKNNRVVASDYLDTQWVFNINKVDDNSVYLEFEGTAK